MYSAPFSTCEYSDIRDDGLILARQIFVELVDERLARDLGCRIVVAVAIVSFSEREEPSGGMFVRSGYAKPVLEATKLMH